MVFLGVALIIVAGFWVLGDSDDLSKRMPTQVPPKSLAVVPLVFGVSILIVGLLRLA